MKTLTTIFLLLALAVGGSACGDSGDGEGDPKGGAGSTTRADPVGGAPAEEDHAHEETPLGTVTIGGMEVELAQGHGGVAAGQEGHLVVKLPYKDNGATIVRAWIGTEDRTLSFVGKGDYAPSHDDYDVHAMASEPLPENPMWWIEIEKPDGTKVVGSAQPKME